MFSVTFLFEGIEKPLFSYIIKGMNEATPLPYLEPERDAQEIPFERFLPPYSAGVARMWLNQHNSPGVWVLEPIGASPKTILEIAQAGYKVLVAINNPVSAFELIMLARSPSKDEFRSVLSELAVQKRGNERLESHILNLYLTRCASCGKEISATGFLWRKSEAAPFARDYTCPACGDAGEHPVTEEDIERLAVVQRSDPLHRARAIERVPGGTKEAREHLEEVLKVYAARPLYALFTLINKVEGLSLNPQRRALIDALLLSTLDAGHSLWQTTETNERPRMLNTPAEYLEKNIWMALENAVNLWTSEPEPIPLKLWPDLPESAGICLFPGRMRDFLQQKPSIQMETVVCVLPRPNQAFWTLSTLWSSWLWGKENAASLKNVLERQRFDWYWHANALQSVLAPAARLVKENTYVFSLLPEPTAGFVAAAVEASVASGLALSGWAYKNEEDPIQLEWLTQRTSHEIKKVNLHRIIRESIHDLLIDIGEPCRYLKLFTRVITALAQENAFPKTIQQLTFETAAEIQTEIAKVFSDRKFLRRLDATAQDLESGFWWLTQSEGCQVSLADRVETELINWLQKEKKVTSQEIHHRILQRFPGFSTPPDDLLEFCLHSYADFDPQDQTWNLKENELSGKRKKDLDEIQEFIRSMAEKFGLECKGENPISWFNKARLELPRYQIFLSVSALVSRFARPQYSEPVETVFVFPGSRSALLRFKLDRDPNLRDLVSSHWHFLKYRTLRDLAQRKDISLDLWDLFIDSDPISLEDATQLSMFL
ncbi:MAG: hypothetical protein C0401_06065 [Anaerolinea sp.]|nr:hypothetical protein [Anaerolinea sp.]